MLTHEEMDLLAFLEGRSFATVAELHCQGLNDQMVSDLESFGLVSVFYEEGQRSLLQITDRGLELLKTRNAFARR